MTEIISPQEILESTIEVPAQDPYIFPDGRILKKRDIILTNRKYQTGMGGPSDQDHFLYSGRASLYKTKEAFLLCYAPNGDWLGIESDTVKAIIGNIDEMTDEQILEKVKTEREK